MMQIYVDDTLEIHFTVECDVNNFYFRSISKISTPVHAWHIVLARNHAAIVGGGSVRSFSARWKSKCTRCLTLPFTANPLLQGAIRFACSARFIIQFR